MTNILWLALLGFVLSQPQLLDVGGSEPKAITDLMPFFNKMLKGGLFVLMAIIVWDIASHIWRLMNQESIDSQAVDA